MDGRFLCLDCLDERFAPPSPAAASAAPTRPRLDMAALRARLPGRARTDDERLHRPGAVFYALVAVFIGFCVAAAVAGGSYVSNLDRFLAIGVAATGWIISLCFHEYAHAWVAYRFGGDVDVPGKGYLTLDPRRYADPIGSVVFPIGCLFVGGVPLPGGAVYVNRERIWSRNVLVAIALAGVATNLVFAVVVLAVVRIGVLDGAPTLNAALAFLGALEIVTVLLNLLPFPGLDGYHAIEPFLPRDVQLQVARLGYLPMIVLFFLVFATHAFDFMWDWSFTVIEGVGIERYLAPLGAEIANPNLLDL